MILSYVTHSAAELRVIWPLWWTNHSAGVYGSEERPHCVRGENTTAAQSQLSPQWGAAADAEQGGWSHMSLINKAEVWVHFVVMLCVMCSNPRCPHAFLVQRFCLHFFLLLRCCSSLPFPWLCRQVLYMRPHPPSVLHQIHSVICPTHRH